MDEQEHSDFTYSSHNAADTYKQLGSNSDAETIDTPEHVKPSHLIVEIGAGRYDAIRSWKSVADRRHFESNQQYVGIDLGVKGSSMAGVYERSAIATEDALMRQQWTTLKNERPNEAIDFIQADGTKLPIQDGAADEVILSNVFGYGASSESWPGLLSEAYRVVKSQGVIVIHDDQSPYHTSAERMNDVVVNAGISPDSVHLALIEQLVDAEKYDRLSEQYGFDTDHHRQQNNILWLITKSSPVQHSHVQQDSTKSETKHPWWRRGNR